MYLFIYLLIYLFIYLFIYLLIYLPIALQQKIFILLFLSLQISTLLYHEKRIVTTFYLNDMHIFLETTYSTSDFDPY